MAVLAHITEGWTDRLGPFVLRVDGTPFDMTGMNSISLVLRNKNGGTVDTSGDVTQDVDPTTGKVYYKPDSTDFKATLSPYTVHWKVEDGAGDIVFFPNGEADTIVVHKR